MRLDFNQGNIVYVIDTSGLIKLESTFKYDNPVFIAIWEEIEELIEQDRFKTIDFVEDEINNYQGKQDFFKEMGEEVEKAFCCSYRCCKYKCSYFNN